MEIMTEIVGYCAPSTIAILCRCSQRLYVICSSILYEDNVRFDGSSAVFSAIHLAVDEIITLRTLHAAAGANADFGQLRSISLPNNVPHRDNFGFFGNVQNPRSCSMTMTPLHYAAFCGFDEVISFLLEKAPGVDTAVEGQLRTPLFAAIYGGKGQTAMMLMDRGASPTREGSDTTALHLAAAANLPDILTYLVRTVGMDINAEDARGDTPLIYGLMSPQMSNESISHLVGLGANIDQLTATKQGYTSPLGIACNLSKWDFAETLLDSGARPEMEKTDRSPGQVGYALQPLRYALGASPHYGPERMARGKKRVIARLLDAGADPNEEVEIYGYGGDRHRTGSLLHRMISLESDRETRLLIKSENTDINRRDNEGMTPLGYALSTEDGHPHIAALLLRHGAEIPIESVEKIISLIQHIWQTPNAMEIKRTVSGHPKLGEQLHILFNECSGQANRVAKAFSDCPLFFVDLMKDMNKAKKFLTNGTILEAMRDQFEVKKKRKAAPTRRTWWESRPVKRSCV